MSKHVTRAALILLSMLLLTSCATTAMLPTAPKAAVTELAPSGTLRAAINFGNPILATRDPVTGEPRGVSVDLARELGKRLGVPVELVSFMAAGKVAEGARTNAWDVAFVAIDPVRGVDMEQTAAYVVIEGAYLVPAGSPITTNAQVDRPDIRVVVAEGSAYDLYLTRELKQARLVRVPTSPVVVDSMVAQRLDVSAGVRQQMQADAKRVPAVRLIDGRFMVINQAMATPKGRVAGARYLDVFVEDVKASGLVAAALARHGIEGASVAPPATP